MTATAERALDILQSLVGAERARLIEPGMGGYDPHPLPLVHALPRTRDELAEIVRAAARDDFDLVPVGGNTSPRTSQLASRPLILLSTEYLDRIVAHEIGDLTLTAECGLGITTINDTLRRWRQFVAFDPPEPDRATLGGVIAAATEGPLAARHGPVRDQILGLTIVDAEGTVTHCGGRVVKNVTGYDLCRLYTGSRGALGIIVEATVRLRPLPESAVRILFEAEDEDAACEAAFRLRLQVPDLSTIHVLSGAALAEFRVEAPHAAVVAQVAGLRALVSAVTGEARAACDAIHFIEARDVEAPATLNLEAPAGCTVVRLGAPPAHWRAQRALLAPRLAPPFGVVHDVLRGVRDEWFAPTDHCFTDEKALEATLTAAGMTLDLPRDPGFHRTLLDRFPGQTPGGLEIMRALKRAADPAARLNPGRTSFG